MFKIHPTKTSLILPFKTKNILYYFYSNSYKNTVYFAEGLDSRRLNSEQQLLISKIVNKTQHQHSFMVYNSFEAKRKIKDWFIHLPWVKPYYAIKANPFEGLCKDLSRGGAGMDCASKNQIKLALQNGVLADNIVYSNSIKNPNDLDWAYKNKIMMTTADSIDQLQKILQIAPKMKILWRVAVKEQQFGDSIVTFSKKFGDDLETPQKIHNRMKQIQQMGINLQGIHFHSGSSRQGSQSLKKGILLARQCIKIGRKYGHKMQLLDTGGGFPSDNITQQIVDAFEITKNDPLKYQTISQPGRHFSDNMFYVLTQVIGRREKSNVKCYHVNDSIFHTFNPILYQKITIPHDNQFYGKVQNQKVVPLQELENSAFFGMTCDGNDILFPKVNAPKNIQIGDWICVGGLGSYSLSVKSTFNGMEAANIIQNFAGDIQPKINRT